MGFALIILSCKNHGPSYVKGTVSERGTNNPINQACIILDKDKYALLYGYKESTNDDTTFSNENGEYKIKFTRNPTARYTIECYHPDYFTNYNEATKDYIIKHGKTALNFTLIPKAYVKLRFIKTNTNYSYISGKFNNKVSFYSPYYSSPGTNTTYDITPSTTYAIYGNETNYVSWFVSDIGQTQSNTIIKDNFFVAKGDTTTFTIQF